MNEVEELEGIAKPGKLVAAEGVCEKKLPPDAGVVDEDDGANSVGNAVVLPPNTNGALGGFGADANTSLFSALVACSAG